MRYYESKMVQRIRIKGVGVQWKKKEKILKKDKGSIIG